MTERLDLALVLTLLDDLVVLREIQADAVDAMPLVRRGRKALTLKDVSQVSTTVRANNLRPRNTKGAVLIPSHGAWEAVKVGRPPAARLELVVGLVQEGVAPGAGIDSCLGVVLVELAGSRRFSALLPQNTKLVYRFISFDLRVRNSDQCITFVENSTPLVVGALVGISHVGCLVGCR